MKKLTGFVVFLTLIAAGLYAGADETLGIEACRCKDIAGTVHSDGDYVEDEVEELGGAPSRSPNYTPGFGEWDSRTTTAVANSAGGSGAFAECSVSIVCFDNVPLGTDSLNGNADATATTIRKWAFSGAPEACPGAEINGAFTGNGKITGSASVVGNTGTAAATSSLSAAASGPCITATSVSLSDVAKARYNTSAAVNIGGTGKGKESGAGMTIGGSVSNDPWSGIYSSNYTLALNLNGKVSAAVVIMPFTAAVTGIVQTTADGSWAGSTTSTAECAADALVAFSGSVSKCPTLPPVGGGGGPIYTPF